MWRCCVLVILVGQFWTIQTAVVDQHDNVRVARQLGVTECCPCDRSEGRPWDDRDKAADSTPALRMGVVDDCPCQGRSADADGASSILFPNAVRALRPLLKSDEAKKDLKPLLHPEVDLASSVLSTLKEVTEQDYQDALARDAARSAAKMIERDAQPKESPNNLVTIVLGPNSDTDVGDFVAQESRNVPLDCAKSSIEPTKQAPSLLDSIWSPSNTKTTRFKPKLLDINKYVDARNEKISDIKSKIQNFKSNSIFNNVLDKTVKPKDIGNLEMSTRDDCPEARSKTNSDISNIDSDVSPSNTEPKYTEYPESDIGEIMSRPIKNLLKLRDVELIPRNVFGENKLAKPQELIPPLNLDGLKARIHQLKLPNLIEKIKRRESVQKIKPKNFVNEDNRLAASDVQEQITKLPSPEPFTKMNPITLFSKLESLNNANKLASKIPGFAPLTDIAKINNSLQERLSRIPNLLEGLRNQKNNLEDSDASASNKDRRQIDTIKSDISTKLKAMREKTRNLLSERGVVPNLTTGAEIKKLEMVKIDSILKPKQKSAGNLESDVARDFHETPIIRESPVQTSIPDVVPSPSENSPTLIKSEKHQLRECENEHTSPENEDLNEDNGMVSKPLSDSFQSELDKKEISDDNIKNSFQNENDDINKDFNIIQEKSALPPPDKETFRENKQIDNCSLEDNYSEIKETNVPSLTENEGQNFSENLSSEFLPKSDANIESELNEPEIQFAPEEKTAQIANKSVDDNSNNELEIDSNGNQETVDPTSENTNLNEEPKEVSSNENEDDLNITEDLSNSSTNEHPVTLHDLQKMSDSLLHEDEQQKRSESFLEQGNDKLKSTCNELKSDSERDNLQNQPNTGDIFISDPEERNSQEVNFVSSTTEAEPIAFKNSEPNFDENIKEKGTCASDLAREIQTPKDATPEASELIPSTLRSPLINLNRIIEPASMNGLNNLLNAPRPEIGDILKLNTKLPSLDEIHSKVANVLNPLPILSLGKRPDTIERNRDLIPDPSEQELKSVPFKFSPEPIEIDVFQMNPLSSSRTPSSNLARMNLDTLRTQLAMPKSLGIKPLRLESAVGDKRGMVGASLLFGSDKKDLMKAESTTLLEKLRNSNSLQRPIGDLPSLEEIGNRMRERFSNLFDIDTTPTYLGTKSIESLRSRAEDGVKNLHNTLQSSMRKAKETSSNILSNAYAQPNNLIEELSQRHEDLTDKLKGIHYDLNDRLTSLHDSFLEKTKLPNLNLFQPKDDVDDYEIIPKFNSQRMQPGRKKVKKLTRNNDDLYSQSKPNLERIKKFHMTPSASVQVPKTMATPKLMKSQNDLTMQPLLREAKPAIKQQNKPLLNMHPLHTQIASKRSQPVVDLKTNAKYFSQQFLPKSVPNKTLPKVSMKHSKILRDAKTAPSVNFVSKQSPASNSALERSNSKSLVPERDSQRKATIFTPTKLKTADDLRKAFALPNLSWPKPTENSFLTKVREALRTRLDGAKSVDKTIGKPISTGDMDRSASTNVKSIDLKRQPIKEKTSYKCKMICTRDSSELN